LRTTQILGVIVDPQAEVRKALDGGRLKNRTRTRAKPEAKNELQ
jgi:hypothetical protein